MDETPKTPEEHVEERAVERAKELTETVKAEASAVTETVKEEAGGVTERADQTAADLAQMVKDEAAAVTERVEKRAVDLEERRVEHRAEERIEQRADLKTELSSITTAIGMLVDHMDKSLPEERIKQMAEAVLADERLGRKRLATKITGFLVVITLLVVTSFLQSAANGRTLDEAKKVASYVENCLQHPERLTPQQKVEKCGSDDANVKIIKGLLDGINCSLLISPEARTETNTAACAAKAFGQ